MLRLSGKTFLTVTVLMSLVGCSQPRMDENWQEFFSGMAQDVAKSDCDVYTPNTSAHEECIIQVDTFYKEHYNK